MTSESGASSEVDDLCAVIALRGYLIIRAGTEVSTLLDRLGNPGRPTLLRSVNQAAARAWSLWPVRLRSVSMAHRWSHLFGAAPLDRATLTRAVCAYWYRAAGARTRFPESFTIYGSVGERSSGSGSISAGRGKDD